MAVLYVSRARTSETLNCDDVIWLRQPQQQQAGGRQHVVRRVQARRLRDDDAANEQRMGAAGELGVRLNKVMLRAAREAG